MRRQVSTFALIILWGRCVGLSQIVSEVDSPAFISGTVTDKQSGEPIPDVNVFVVGTQKGRATDINGRYFLGLLRHGSCTIEFSHVSYERIGDTLYLNPGDTTRYDVRLTKRSVFLEEVEIRGQHPRSPEQWKGTSGRVFTREEIEGKGIRRFGDLLRLMSPGASVTEMGPDLFIDLNKSSRRTSRPPVRDYFQNTNPLIFLNGMRIGKSPQGLSLLIKPEEIDEIVVLKGMESDMYGYEGRDGIIIVKTTPQPDTSGLSLTQKILYTSAVVGGVLLISVLFLK